MKKEILKKVKFHNEKMNDCILEFNNIKNIRLKSYIKRTKQLKVMIRRHRLILTNLREFLIYK